MTADPLAAGDDALPLPDLRHLDAACARFEEAWRAGLRPRIDEFLAGTSGRERDYLFHELLLAELELEQAGGRTAQESEYRQRFPEYGSVIQAVFAERRAAGGGGLNEKASVSGSTLAPGVRLGPYEILDILGAGGMGRVFRARDVRLDREVAVKVLPDQFAQDPERLARFEREAKVVAHLSHPSIVVLHDIGQDHGVFFAVMELLCGEDLRRRVRQTPLPWQQVVDIGVAVADGLGAAHAKGIVHRDIKPENLFLTADGRIKILDFGLARVEEAVPLPPAVGGVPRPVPTEPGALMGTVGYMAPEQIRGQTVDGRSDLFALGCVLYELVTGRRAFWRDSAVETHMAILHEDPPDPALSGQQVPPALAAVLQRCLEKEPAARYPSAEELTRALRALRGPLDDSIPRARRPAPWRRVALSLGILGLLSFLVVGVYLTARPRGPSSHDGPAEADRAIESLAVLPFLNVGDDEGTAHLGDGMTITLSNRLSQLRRLKVRPYSAVTPYKGRAADLPAVGRELQVEAVLTGTVQKRGNDLFISVQLVDVRENRVLWTDEYHRRYDNLLAVQSEIARAVTAKLRLQLGSEDEQQLAKRPTADLNAYRAYILGDVEWNKRTEEGLENARKHFTDAIRRDPDFALAHVGLANCHINLAERGLRPSKDAYPKAREAATRAVQLEDSLAAAHVALAMIRFEFDWDFAGAEQEFQRALALEPNHPTGRQWYAEFLSAMGRHAEALTEVREAQTLDPNSAIISTIHGVLLYKAGPARFDEAIAQFRRTLERHRHFTRLRGYLASVYEQQGMYPEALEQWDFLLEGDPASVNRLRQAWQAFGTDGYWKCRLDLKDHFHKRYPLSRVFTAELHARLKQYDTAFAVLEEAFREQDGALAPNLKVNPCFDALRSDERFDRLLRRMNYPP
ncbi:MAG: protein kinase [Gemmataceae bacterium]|nr:protein kinase [Gemmataceae bacterium]